MDNFGKNVMGFVYGSFWKECYGLRGATSWAHGPMGPWAQGPWAQGPWAQGPGSMGPWVHGPIGPRNLNQLLIHFWGKKTTFFGNKEP